MKTFDVVALGELLVDFTENGLSAQGNPLLEANPGGAPCNVLSMLQNLGKKTAFIGKVGADALGQMLIQAVRNQGINTDNLLVDDTVHTTLAFVHTDKDGDRSFSFYRNPGADMMLRWDEVHEDMLADTKIFHFGTLSMTDAKSILGLFSVDLSKPVTLRIDVNDSKMNEVLTVIEKYKAE